MVKLGVDMLASDVDDSSACFQLDGKDHTQRRKPHYFFAARLVCSSLATARYSSPT